MLVDFLIVHQDNCTHVRKSAEDWIAKTNVQLTPRPRLFVLQTETCIWMVVEQNVLILLWKCGLIVIVL